MDADRFDTLTRSLTEARSRRGALATLLGGTLGLLGLADTAAKKKKKKKKKGGNPPPSTCEPECTGGGQTCQGGICVCPSGTQFCPIPNNCRQCCSNVDCCGALLCPPGAKICSSFGTCA